MQSVLRLAMPNAMRGSAGFSLGRARAPPLRGPTRRRRGVTTRGEGGAHGGASTCTESLSPPSLSLEPRRLSFGRRQFIDIHASRCKVDEK